MTHTTPPVVIGVIDKQPTALRFAIREARRLNTGLRVIHAYGELPEYRGMLDTVPGSLEGLRRQGQDVLDGAQHFIDQEPSQPSSVEYALSRLMAIPQLEEESRHAALLVLGIDDVSLFDRLIGGAVTARVTKAAACPVAVVPETTYPRSNRGGVVVALDGATAASGPLTFAFQEAQAGSRHLDVLHSVPASGSASDAEAARANIAEIVAGWRARYPDVRVTTTFTAAEPDEAYRSASRRAEIVVVGRRRSRTPFAAARSAAAALVREAHGPVAVVPADYTGNSR